MSEEKDNQKNVVNDLHKQLNKVGYWGDVQSNYRDGSRNSIKFTQKVPFSRVSSGISIIVVELGKR